MLIGGLADPDRGCGPWKTVSAAYADAENLFAALLRSVIANLAVAIPGRVCSKNIPIRPD